MFGYWISINKMIFIAYVNSQEFIDEYTRSCSTFNWKVYMGLSCICELFYASRSQLGKRPQCSNLLDYKRNALVCFTRVSQMKTLNTGLL